MLPAFFHVMMPPTPCLVLGRFDARRLAVCVFLHHTLVSWLDGWVSHTGTASAALMMRHVVCVCVRWLCVSFS